MKTPLAGLMLVFLSTTSPAWATDPPLDPKLIQNSPVLRRWLKKTPDIRSDIANDPSFRTRYRVGYSQSDQASGLTLGIEDLRIDRTRFTLSAAYQTGTRSSVGADLQYYVRPLGSYINVAPVVGYRHLKNGGDTIDGANLGVKVLLVLSRGGGTDISLTQSWVSPFSENETALTRLSVGYALTHNLRLSTDLQRQNSRLYKDSRFGIVLEWMP